MAICLIVTLKETKVSERRVSDWDIVEKRPLLDLIADYLVPTQLEAMPHQPPNSRSMLQCMGASFRSILL